MNSAEVIAELETLASRLTAEASVTIVYDSPERIAISQAASDLKVALHQVKLLRDGLAVYAPGPFWTDAVPATSAAADAGKHAEWLLRLTDPDAA